VNPAVIPSEATHRVALSRDLLLLAGLILATPLAAQEPSRFFVRDRVIDATANPNGALIAYTQRTADSANNRFNDEVFVIPAKGGEPWLLGPGSRPAFAPVGQGIGWIGPQGELWSRDSLAGADSRLLGRGTNVVTMLRWSPDGARVALDSESDLLNDSTTTPWPGSRRSIHVTDSVRSLRLLTPRDLHVGPSDPELQGGIDLDWLDDSTLVVAGRDLSAGIDPDASHLYLVRLAGGTPEYLIGEGGRWHTPVVSPDGEWIAFTGHPVGSGPWTADELLVVRRDGTGLKRLTVGLDRDVRDVHWESDSRHLWFATEDRGVRNLQRIDSRNGRLGSATTGSHFLRLGVIPRRGDWAVAVQSSIRTAGALVRFPLERPDRLQALITPDVEVPTGEIEEFDFRVSDGTVLSAWLFRPPGFDPDARYPLLVDIHGGPHAMAGHGYAPFALAHAAGGRLVLRVNPRGSTGYGFDIVNGLSAGWPGQDVADLSEAISEVIARGLVDTTRIAAVGQAAGGVVAEALRQADPRIGRTILRCTGGAWLQGSDAPDLAPWGEWTASRPFRRTIDRWMADNPVQTAAATRTPVLVVEGTPVAPRPVAFGESLHLLLARAGVPTSFHRLPTDCASAGPVSQLDLFMLEAQWLTTRP
jgi:dipeptidyl aminopeptidase/acylaminoacyl peptidase